MIKELLIVTITLLAIASAFPAPGDLEDIPEGAAFEPVGDSDDFDVAESRYGGGYGGYGGGYRHGGYGGYGGGHRGGGWGGYGGYGGGHRHGGWGHHG